MSSDFAAEERWAPTPFTPRRRRDWPWRGNLPHPLSALVGRENEISAVSHLLLRSDVRLVVLIGPGGVGKTRLAIRISSGLADEFNDGVCFVPLAAVTDPQLVPVTIAKSVGIADSGDLSSAALLRSELRDANLLLVLDNFEQITSST